METNNLLLELVKNIESLVEKSKSIEQKVDHLDLIVKGNETINRVGLTETVRNLLKDINSLRQEITDKISPYVDELNDRFNEISILEKNSLEHIKKLPELLTRLETIENFLDSIKNLPAKILLGIPLITFLFNVFVYYMSKKWLYVICT